MGKFIISTRKNGEFQFNLKAANGQVILSSEGYSSKAGCQNGIESVRKNSQDDSKFERLTSKDDRFYFNLKATNGQVIGSSQMYESDNGMEKGIESVKNNAPNASVEEELD
ncbi:YegP family protein [Chryseobacterium gambrini]|uniref:YegP family protein n=1 Tax=Chryseobacterium gambrini TaxID=373672 RepID=UPI003D115B47